MNDVTYRFKSIATMKFFNLANKCTTSGSCLFKRKNVTEALNLCTIFFPWNGREKKDFFS